MEKISFCEALVKAQTDCMEADPNVFIFGLDVADHKRIFGSTKGILEKFGEKRIFPTPLSEDAMTGIALGAALAGLRPVHVHIRTDFMLLGMNQIANMVSCIRYLSGGKHKVPLVIRAVIGRGWGQGAQHSKTLHNFFAHIPGLKVVMPTTPQDAYSLLRASIQDDNPVIFLEHRWLYFAEDEVDYSKKMEIGKARVVAEGSDVTFICVSWMNVEALQARKVLAAHNISVEVVDISTISPLDTETLVRSVKKTGRAVVLDYDWVQYGLSGEIAAVISKECFSELKLPVERLGFQQTPCPTERTLEDEFYPGALTAIRTVEKMFKKDPMDLKRETFYSYETKFKGPF